jgi:hypothetical protein
LFEEAVLREQHTKGAPADAERRGVQAAHREA